MHFTAIITVALAFATYVHADPDAAATPAARAVSHVMEARDTTNIGE